MLLTSFANEGNSSGAKSTTEIVLQGYNCHLTMLDNKSDGIENLTSPNVDNSKISNKPDQSPQDFDIEDEVPF